MRERDFQAIAPGWEMFGADGQKIGSVDEVGDDYVLVTKGLLLPSDHYVPVSAITSVDAGATRILANVTRDQIDGMGWSAPPTEPERDRLDPIALDRSGDAGRSPR